MRQAGEIMKRPPSCQLELTMFCLVTLGFDRMLLFSNFDERQRASTRTSTRGMSRRASSESRACSCACACACARASVLLALLRWKLLALTGYENNNANMDR